MPNGNDHLPDFLQDDPALQAPGFRQAFSGFLEAMDVHRPGHRVRTPEDALPDSQFLRPINNMINTGRMLLGSLGIDIGPASAEEVLGPTGLPPVEGAEDLDVLDPRVQISEDVWERMSDQQRQLRILRRLLSATGRGTLLMPMLQGEPLTQVGAQAEGIIAPPVHSSERAADFVGEAFLGGLIPGVGAFGAALGPARLLARTGLPLVGREAGEKLLKGSLGRRFAQRAGSPTEAGLEAATRGGAERLAALRTADVVSGASVTGGYAAREAYEVSGTPIPEDMEIFGRRVPGEAVLGGMTALGGAIGLAGARIYSTWAGRKMVKSAERLEDLARHGLESGIVGIPRRVGDFEFTGQFTKAGEPRFKDAQTGRFVSVEDGPSAEDIQRAVLDHVGPDLERLGIELPETRAPRDAKEPVTGTEGAERAAVEATAGEPLQVRPVDVDLPPVDPTHQHITAIAADYRGQARRMVMGKDQMSDEHLGRMLQYLRATARDPDADELLRVTAHGRARAIEAAMREKAGQGVDTALGIEWAAKDLSAIPDDGLFHQQIARAASYEDPAWKRIAQRAQQLRDGTKPPRAHDDVNKAIESRHRVDNRGLTANREVILDDGRHAILTDDPQWGFARADVVGEGVVDVDLRRVTPVPDGDEFVELAGAQVGRVTAVDKQAGKATVELPKGEKIDVNLNELDKLSKDFGPWERDFKRRFTEASKAAPEEAIQVQHRVEAVDRVTGQRVLVEQMGESESVVRTKMGVRRTVSNDDLTVGSRQRVDEPSTETPIFEPGTKPREGHHINFVRLTEDQAERLAAGTPLSQLTDRLNVLPTPARQGTKLYAVEVPSDARQLTTGSKRTLGVLAGNEDPYPQMFQSQVRVSQEGLEAARVFEVPDGLQQRVDRWKSIKDLDPEDRLDYIRRLTDFGFDEGGDVARAKQRASSEFQRKRDAEARGDIGEAELAELDADFNLSEMVEAEFVREEQLMDNLWDAAEAQLRRNADEIVIGAELRARAGDEEGFVELLSNLPADGAPLVIPARGNPDVRAVITKSEIPTTRTVFDVEPAQTAPGLTRPPREAPRPRGRRVPDRRTVYRVEFIDTRGAHLTGPNSVREISSVVDHIRVPESAAPRARAALQEQLRSGEVNPAAIERQFADVERRILGADGKYKIPGGGKDDVLEVEVLNPMDWREGADRVAVRTADGETLEVAANRIQDVEFRRENWTDIGGGIRIPEDQQIQRVFTAIRNFDHGKMFWHSAGEWRHPSYRGIYATVREHPQADRWVARIYRETSAAADDPRAEAFSISGDSPDAFFRTREEAIRFLEEQHGFHRLVDEPRADGPMGEISPGLSPSERPVVEGRRPRLTEEDIGIAGVDDPAEVRTKLDEQLAEILALDRNRQRRAEADELLTDLFSIAGRRDPEFQEGMVSAVTELRRTQAAARGQEPTLTEERVFNDLFRAAQVRERGPGISERTGLQDPAAIQTSFRNLPEVEGIPVDLMPRYRDDLEYILGAYAAKNRGYIPSPMLDYAHRFGLRWRNLGLQAEEGSVIKNGALRRRVGLYEARDAERQARLTRAASHNESMGRVGEEVPRIADVDFEPGFRAFAKETTYDVPNETYRLLPGRVMDVAPMSERVRQMRDLASHMEHNERFMGLLGREVGGPGELEPSTWKMPVVEYGPERRLAEVVDVNYGRDDIKLRVYDPEPHEVVISKDQVRRIRAPDKELNVRSAFEEATTGKTRYERTPETGFGQLEKDIGVFGVQDKDALQSRILQHTEEVLSAEGAHLNPEKMKFATRAWIRGKELGFGRDFEDQLVKRLQDSGDPRPRMKLRETLDNLAYNRIRNDLSPLESNPYSYAIAKAKVGRLSSGESKALRKWAPRFDIDTNQPDYRIVEDMIEKAWDPLAAELIFRTRRDLGFARLRKEGNFPDGGIEIVSPDVGRDMRPFEDYWMIPRTMAEMHPTSRLWHYNKIDAKFNEERMTAEGFIRIQGIKEKVNDIGIDPDDFRVWAREHSDFDSLREAVPDVPRALREPFEAYQEFANRALNEVIRDRMRRGMKVIRLREVLQEDGGELEVRRLLQKDYDLEEDVLDRTLTHLRENPDDIYIAGETFTPENVRPDHEIERFLDLRRMYDSTDDMPGELVQDLPDWMLNEFRYWKDYGLDNYWPEVHQGRLVIEHVGPDGEITGVGFAPSYPDAIDILKRLYSRGTSFGSDAQFRIREKASMIHDVDTRLVHPDEFRALLQRGRRLIEKDPAEVAEIMRQHGILVRSPTPEPVHARQRVADLEGGIDPFRSLQIYWARLARNKYNQEIHRAWNLARKMDESLSNAFGTDPVMATRKPSFQRLQNYMRYDYNRALGQETGISKAMDVWASVGDYFLHGGGPAKRVMDRIMKDDMSFLEAMRAERELGKLFARPAPGIGTKAAMAKASLQGVLRLSNPGSVMVNLTQTFTNTMPLAGHRNTLRALDDLRVYWRQGPDTKRGAELEQLAEELGVRYFTTSKATGYFDPSMLKSPLISAEDNLLIRGWKHTEYWGMWAFNGSDRVNRLISGFAGYRKAIDQGMSHDSAVQFAQRMIERTQFHYFDEALPKILSGPLSKVLFQFRTYMMNQAKFTKDIYKNAYQNPTPENLKAAVAHTGWYFALGGLRGMGNHPYLTGLLMAGTAWGADSNWLEAKLLGKDGRRRYENWPESQENPLFQWKNFKNHGLPGLLGLSMGRRIGVSGQDVFPNSWEQLLVGPHHSMYLEFGKAIRAFQNTHGGGTTVPGLAAAGALNTLMQSRNPVAPILSGIGGLTLASAPTDNPFWNPLHRATDGFRRDDFLGAHPAGRRFTGAVMPTIMRGAESAYDFFSHGQTLDSNMNPDIVVPMETRALESVLSVIGIQSARSAENSAYIRLLSRQDDLNRNTRSMLLRQIGLAAAEGDQRMVLELMRRAQRQGIRFEEEDFKEVRDRVTSPRVRNAVQRMMKQTRREVR